MFVRCFFLIAISLSASIGIGNSATPAEPSLLAQQQTSPADTLSPTINASVGPSASPNVGHKENPNAKKLRGVLHKESGSTGASMLSLQDAIAHANSSPGTRNDFSLWDEIRRTHLPKLNTDYIKGYGEKNVENLRTAILISRYVQRKLHDLLDNPKALIDDAALMGRIDSTYTPQFAHALRGYLLFAAGRYAEALQSLQQAGPAVSVGAQQMLNEEACYGIGLGLYYGKEGRAYLNARALAGDKHAQILRLRDFYFHFYNAISGR